MPRSIRVSYTANIKLTIIVGEPTDKNVLLDKVREVLAQWEMNQNDQLALREENQIVAMRIHVLGDSEKID